MVGKEWTGPQRYQWSIRNGKNPNLPDAIDGMTRQQVYDMNMKQLHPSEAQLLRTAQQRNGVCLRDYKWTQNVDHTSGGQYVYDRNYKRPETKGPTRGFGYTTGGGSSSYNSTTNNVINCRGCRKV